ncbi:MAG: pentapeptide repeat-containing protein, partial [Bacteroidetes bacterium]|nr:pentapeptide repeat-containing protein [Bacteroidota bacterium]
MRTYTFIFLLIGLLFALESEGQQRIINDSNFVDSTFIEEVIFCKATFTKYADFSAARFTKDAVFEGATFTKEAAFGIAKFTKDADFFATTFTKIADFTNATFTKDVVFSEATFTKSAWFRMSTFTKDAIFWGATFTKYADFSAARFTKDAVFRGMHLTDSASFNFEFSRLPNSLDFSENPKISNEIDFRVCFYKDTSYYNWITGKYKPHHINLYKSDVSKFRLEYKYFLLWFPDEASNDERSSIYEALLLNFKVHGQTDSYQKLDIEYQEFKWKNTKVPWFGVFLRYWWNFGYN